VLDNGVKLTDHKTMSPADMAMIEIAQFTEGRIADLLGVPRALVGLPTGDSFTYSNVSSWFDHHDRTTLRPQEEEIKGLDITEHGMEAYPLEANSTGEFVSAPAR
jgi:phage portal protein BeeE